jgi:hypothetical protein
MFWIMDRVERVWITKYDVPCNGHQWKKEHASPLIERWPLFLWNMVIAYTTKHISLETMSCLDMPLYCVRNFQKTIPKC